MNFIKMVSLFMAGLIAWFQPLQIQHGQQGCCAECALKKEEDQIEVVHQEIPNTTC
jgi:hypothetical protein